MKKKSDNCFTFSFKNMKDRKMSYYATYHPNKRLEIDSFEPDSKCPDTDCRREVDEKKTWEIFFDNATFEGILKAIKPPEANWLSLEPDDLSKSNLQEFLEQIRDEPYYLTNPQVFVSFADLINEMKWNPMAAKKIRTAFMKYFIPRDIKYRKSKPIPPIKLPLELLKKLAKHLSDKCKGEVARYTTRQELESPRSKEYQRIIFWASDNEPRICRVKPGGIDAMISSMKEREKNIPLEKLLTGYALSMVELKRLIFSYASYAEMKLKRHLAISTSTIRRRT